MFKFGLEKEYFIANVVTEELMVVPTNLPYDESGILVEFRSDAFADIYEAVYNLEAHTHKVLREQLPSNLYVLDNPVMKVSRDLRLKASRVYAKGLTSYQNIYGHTRHRNSLSEHTAGVHISVTYTKHVYCDKETVSYYGMWDWVQFIRLMDEAFADEIKESKRRPGFYEIKSDGRFEYRSLPSNVSMEKIIEVISKVDFNSFV